MDGHASKRCRFDNDNAFCFENDDKNTLSGGVLPLPVRADKYERVTEHKNADLLPIASLLLSFLFL